MSMYGQDYPEPHDPGPDDNPDANSAAALLALVKTGDWLDAQEFPPTQWAVPGLIPEGFGLFTGAPKIGKSWAALGIGLAVASGGHALGKVPTGAPRPVLYLALEDGQKRLQWRARQLLHDGPIPGLFHEVTDLMPAQVVPLIKAWLDKHAGQNPLVMLDTLGKVMPPAHPGEGAYQRDYRIGSTLKRAVDQHIGATLLVVHHVRKAPGEDWMDSTSGTNGLNGAADFTINLHRSRNEASGVIRVTGRDVPESEYAVTVNDGAWTLDGNDLADAASHAEQVKATAGLGDISAEVVALVYEHPEGIGPTAVAAAFEGMSASNATTYLTRLEQAGRIGKRSRGLYTPPVTSVTSVTLEAGADVNVTDVTDVTHHAQGQPCPRHGIDLVPERCATCEDLTQGAA